MRTAVCLVFAVVVLAARIPASAQDKEKIEVKMEEPAKKACASALAWLAAKQNKDDGSWSDNGYHHNTAITSFAMLAFISQGHLPNQGQFGSEVAKGMRFLMQAQREDGYLVGARGGNMYCHGMATLALCELWGSTGDDAIKPVLQKAVKLIVESQSTQSGSEGGWRYEPRPSGADISVTIMQVMALRAAKNAGFNVPDKTMKNAIAYVEKCYKESTGGFSYQAGGGAPGFARTAAGCCALFLAGDYNAKQLGPAIEYLKRNFESDKHFCYGHYYAAHAMHQRDPAEWKQWYERLNKYLLPRQGSDGSWTGLDRGGVGAVYQTSIVVIVLSVPTHYLSIFQR
jgi:squalene cyclase